MKVIRTIQQLREQLNQFREINPRKRIGLIPTMGYLHNGHVSLLRRSVAENECSVLSIFVNPLQFGENEDLARYPRDEQRDLQLAEKAGMDIVFLPSVSEMYPQPPLTAVSVSRLTGGLCGASRPGHFDGVCTVVAKLFQIVAPDRAYFGMKDAQQVAVVTQMAADLNIPVDIVPCDIVREADGLALSSRNVYLNLEEREQAVILNKSLIAAVQFIRENKNVRAGDVRTLIMDTIQTSQLANIEYVELVSFPTLTPVSSHDTIEHILLQGPMLAALAVKFGSTRLIDNHLWAKQGG